MTDKTEKQKREEILGIFEKILTSPACNERWREKLLNFGEAISYMAEHTENPERPA